MALKRNFPRPPPKWNATADSPTPGVVKGNRRWTRRLTSRASVQGPPDSRREVMRLVWPRPANARWGRAEHARHRVTLLMLTKLPPLKHCDNKSRSSDEVCGGSTFKIDANAAKRTFAGCTEQYSTSCGLIMRNDVVVAALQDS